jgi:hypothetical protein
MHDQNEIKIQRRFSMKKNSHLFIFLSLLALTLGTLACGAFSSSQPVDSQPVQSAPATEPPVSADSGTDPDAVVPCSQLIPADELNSLILNAPTTLKETSFPGGTSCEWKYTANGAMQEGLFYIQVDFSDGAASMWQTTRKSELSNEPSDIVVNSIDGLVDESYVWSSKVTGLYVVYARKGDKTLIMRYVPQNVLYMANESGIIDMVDRFFNRF